MSALDRRLWMPVDEVRRLIDYDPLTGVFRQKTTTHGGRWPAGRELGFMDAAGYRIIVIEKKKFRACRLAFAIMTGRWPEEVDHIDGSQSDVWSNLRECTHAQNSKNQKVRSNNKTGRTGVYPTASGKRWFAEICSDYRRKRIGTYDTFAEAAAARAIYEAAWHGEFSRGAR